MPRTAATTGKTKSILEVAQSQNTSLTVFFIFLFLVIHKDKAYTGPITDREHNIVSLYTQTPGAVKPLC